MLHGIPIWKKNKRKKKQLTQQIKENQKKNDKMANSPSTLWVVVIIFITRMPPIFVQ